MSKNSQPQIQFLWGLVCSLSSIDNERNNISLFNVIDQISPPKEFFTKKFVPIENEIIISWRRTIDTTVDETEFSIDAEVVIVDPNGGILQRNIFPVVFNKNVRRHRTRIRTPGFFLSKPGDYVYRVSLVSTEDGTPREVGSIPIEVKEGK